MENYGKLGKFRPPRKIPNLAKSRCRTCIRFRRYSSDIPKFRKIFAATSHSLESYIFWSLSSPATFRFGRLASSGVSSSLLNIFCPSRPQSMQRARGQTPLCKAGCISSDEDRGGWPARAQLCDAGYISSDEDRGGGAVSRRRHLHARTQSMRQAWGQTAAQRVGARLRNTRSVSSANDLDGGAARAGMRLRDAGYVSSDRDRVGGTVSHCRAARAAGPAMGRPYALPDDDSSPFEIFSFDDDGRKEASTSGESDSIQKALTGAEFKTRTEAKAVLIAALAEDRGLGAMQDPDQSGGSKITLRCPSVTIKSKTTTNDTDAMTVKMKTRAKYIGRTEKFFKALTRNERENSTEFYARRERVMEDAVKAAGHCPFKAIFTWSSTLGWTFKGNSYVPHDNKCTAFGKLTGHVLEEAMKKQDMSVSTMGDKGVKEKLTGASTNFSAMSMPSMSTLNRAKNAVKNEADEWYEEDWSRLEKYLHDLKELNGSSLHVVLEKGEDNAFKRYFVGVKSSIEVLKGAGIGFYAVDAAHTRHHIAKGMRLYCLVGRSGNNNNIVVAWGLFTSENANNYAWFAQKCDNCGFRTLAEPDKAWCANLEITPVVFSDRDKGISSFCNVFSNMHHANCSKHLCNSARVHLRNLRKTDSAVNVGFHDRQIYRVQNMSTEAAFNTAMRQLRRSNHHLYEYLQNLDPTTWSVWAMSKNNVPCYCQKTSNTVEGTFGVFTKQKKRELHPFKALDELVIYVFGKLTKHKLEVQEWVKNNKLLTPWIQQKFSEQLQMTKSNAGYKIQRLGEGRYLVTDRQSEYQVRHNVCILRDSPSCSPCDHWGQLRAPCRHMILALGADDPDIFSPARRGELVQHYFHDAYSVQKHTAVFANIPELVAPSAKFGRPVIDLSLDDDSSNSDDDGAPEFTMKPPVGFTKEAAQARKRRGRPRTKRIRSRGGRGDRGGKAPERKKLRAGTRSDAFTA